MRIAHITDLHVERPLSLGQLASKRAAAAFNLHVLGRASKFGDHVIRALVPAGAHYNATLFAGRPGVAGFADGAAASATFSGPSGITIGPDLLAQEALPEMAMYNNVFLVSDTLMDVPVLLLLPPLMGRVQFLDSKQLGAAPYLVVHGDHMPRAPFVPVRLFFQR
jgi:hypothetical protein